MKKFIHYIIIHIVFIQDLSELKVLHHLDPLVSRPEASNETKVEQLKEIKDPLEKEKGADLVNEPVLQEYRNSGCRSLEIFGCFVNSWFE